MKESLNQSSQKTESERNSENQEFRWEDVDTVETSKGSTYRYLPDGTTQRFKKVEGKDYEPQSALVYIPDFAWVQQNAPAEVLKKLGESEIAYTQLLLEYAQNLNKAEEKKIYIVDKNGKKLETNQQINQAEGPVYVAFVSKGKADFFIPASHTPKLGFMTFDTRIYQDSQTGQRMRELHLGNKVVQIALKD